MNFRTILTNSAVFLVFALLSGSVNSFAQSIQTADANWMTKAESTRYKQTPRYEETIAFSKRLDAASREIVFESFGKSSEGRDLPLLIADRSGEFSPERTRKQGKAVILIQAAIHAGESDGKDAGLALFRDIAISKIRTQLLENTVLLFVPIYNVDGHELFGKYNRINQNGPEEMGFRANSANQNLNRDYLKAETPETRAWLALWNKWKPDFFIDCHVTDGADFRYNITYEYAHQNEISKNLADWMGVHFEDSVVEKVEARGHLLSKYLQFARREEPKRGVFEFIATPRFATGYTPLRNRIGLLIEAHSMKPYESRVKGTYDLLRFTIEEIAAFRKELFEANKLADQEAANRGSGLKGERFPLEQRIANTPTDFLFKGFKLKETNSEISGKPFYSYTDEPLDETIPSYETAEVSKSVSPPLYYIVPPQWQEVVRTLNAHGVASKRTKEAAIVEVESYKFENPLWATTPFEGRLTLRFSTLPINETRYIPKNSVVIPVSQEASAVIMHFLEPEGPDSAMFWGFFNAIFEQKEYSESFVMDEIAKEMMKKDPKLREEFEERLKNPDFAGSTSARLRFFYERSPYYESKIGVYPVSRIVSQTEASKLSF